MSILTKYISNPMFSPHLTRMTDQFNRLSYGVITEILTGQDLVSRQKLLIYAIETMEVFHSCFCYLSMLTLTFIATWIIEQYAIPYGIQCSSVRISPIKIKETL